jgi:hypothetical protein
MVTKPDQMPVWADQDVIDDQSLQNNVLVPPPEKQQFGWAFKEFPPRNWFNWLGRYTYRWINWLNQQEAQSVVVNAADSVASTKVIDPVNGGLALIYVIDTAVITNYFEGITYIPPSYAGGNAWNIVNSAALSVSAPSVVGSVTVTGGTGPYIIYAQMKIAP